MDCITSTYVSTRGKLVTQFEKNKNITDSKYAIATINGTCAIHLGLKLLGAKYGDEVMLPSLTLQDNKCSIKCWLYSTFFRVRV